MPTKSLNALALPMVISFTFRFLFTLVDLIYATEIKDEVPFGRAAIGLFIPIQTLFIALWVGLSAGFTASISQAFGRRDEARVNALKSAMVKLNVGLVPLLLGFAAVLWFLTPALELEPGLEHDFLTYSLILVIAMPFSGFLSIYPDSLVKAHHDTMTTMKAGMFSTATNVALNTVFVFVFHWGLAGIALATALSRYPGFAYAAIRAGALERKRRAGDWDRGGSHWVRRPLIDVLALGIPGCLAYLLMFGEESLVTRLLTLQDAKDVYLASYAVVNRLGALAIMPAVATAVAVLPFVARLVAEQKTDTVRADLGRSMLLTAGLVALLAVPAGWIFPAQLARYFLGDNVAKVDPETLTSYLALIPFTALAAIPYLLLRPVFEAIGRPRVGVAVTVLRSVAFCMPAIAGGYLAATRLAVDPMLGILLGAMLGQALASLTTFFACRKQLAV